MTKKEILIVHPAMEIGGAERALLGLLDSIDYERFNVDLLLCAHTGDFMPLINENVRLLPYDCRYDFFQSPIIQLIKQGQFHNAIQRLIAKYIDERKMKKTGNPHSVWHSQQIIHRLISPSVPDVKKRYNMAINFLGIPSIVVDHVSADVKMAWVHTDYSKIVANPQLDRRYWNKVDWIVNVSDDCKEVFDSFYPDCTDKSIVIENILNTTLIRKLSQEQVELPFSGSQMNLLSIGRFGEAKNFETIPYYCRKLLDSGFDNFKWYIIGYGGGEQHIRFAISYHNVADHVEILGKKVNPYPYIAACDVYIQPSRFEGKAVTVREAQMLGKPVVVTNYATAKSQITDGVDGLILPMDETEFAHLLIKILQDKSLLQNLSNYCQSHDFGNETEIEKIYKVIYD